MDFLIDQKSTHRDLVLSTAIQILTCDPAAVVVVASTGLHDYSVHPKESEGGEKKRALKDCFRILAFDYLKKILHVFLLCF